MSAKQNLGLVFLGISMVVSAGCYRHSYTVGSGGNTAADPAKSVWTSHWLFGLIGESDVDVKTVCPSGNATLKDEQSFLNYLVSAILFDIYTPTTVEVYCGSGRSATLHLTPQQMRRVAIAPETMVWANRVSSTKATELQAAIEAYRATHESVAGSPESSAF